jgi:hypothetical protein
MLNTPQTLEIIRERPFDMVISGNVFDSDLTGNGAVGLGAEFARLVKQVSPSMLFFMYSIISEQNELMNGDIPKSRVTADRPELHGALVDFLTISTGGERCA